MCFIFLCPHPAHTPSLLPSLPRSSFSDSLSPSCISCRVYVQFGLDWNHIGKTACHLTAVTAVQTYGGGVTGEAVPAFKGAGDTASPPRLPFSPQLSTFPSLMWPLLFWNPLPPRFIDSFKGKFIFHLSLLMVLTRLMLVNTDFTAARP